MQTLCLAMKKQGVKMAVQVSGFRNCLLTQSLGSTVLSEISLIFILKKITFFNLLISTIFPLKTCFPSHVSLRK